MLRVSDGWLIRDHLFSSTLGLTFTDIDDACSFEQGFLLAFLVLSSKLMCLSHAVSECSLFFVQAQLFFSHSPQSSCSCAQELFCSITRLYPELMASSSSYVQHCQTYAYEQEGCVLCLAFHCGFLLCSGEFLIFLRKVGNDFCFLRPKLYILLKCDYAQLQDKATARYKYPVGISHYVSVFWSLFT